MRSASPARASSAARDITSGSASSGIGTTAPSGLSTVSPSAQARSAASRPTATSASPSKMSVMASFRGRCAASGPLIGTAA